MIWTFTVLAYGEGYIDGSGNYATFYDHVLCWNSNMQIMQAKTAVFVKPKNKKVTSTTIPAKIKVPKSKLKAYKSILKARSVGKKVKITK